VGTLDFEGEKIGTGPKGEGRDSGGKGKSDGKWKKKVAKFGG